MITVLGKKGVTFSHQDDFPETTECTCGGNAEIAFVAYEGCKEQAFVCDLHTNPEGGDLWPHDAIAVAVYICTKCLKPVAVLNQG